MNASTFWLWVGLCSSFCLSVFSILQVHYNFQTQSVSLERKAEPFSQIRRTAVTIFVLLSGESLLGYEERNTKGRVPRQPHCYPHTHHVSRLQLTPQSICGGWEELPLAFRNSEERGDWQGNEKFFLEDRNGSSHPCKKKAWEEDGAPPAEPAVQKSALKPGQGRSVSSRLVSFSQKQGGQFACQILLPKPKGRQSVFNREEDFESMLLPF